MSAVFLSGYVPEVEFAREFGVTVRTVRRYRNQVNGLPYVKPGKVVFIPVEQGREWLASQIRKPNATS